MPYDNGRSNQPLGSFACGGHGWMCWVERRLHLVVAGFPRRSVYSAANCVSAVSLTLLGKGVGKFARIRVDVGWLTYSGSRLTDVSLGR